MPENTAEAETNNTQTLYKILICNIYECNTRKKERKIQYHKLLSNIYLVLFIKGRIVFSV